jgi:NAD(P)-dependent dehydrogenase (short-subunit alcohol dehydrogenase family)
MANYLIIGASSGIGRQLALHLAEAGHAVTGTWHRHPIEALHPGITAAAYDATTPGADLSFIPDTLDGLVYCPGTIELKPFHRLAPERFADDYNLNVLGAVRTIQAALPALRKSGRASIVLFSTVAVQTGLNFHSMVSASKGAVEGLTRALAAELAPTIRVNAIAPSLTDTPLAGSLLSTPEKREANAQRHPLRRIGRPDDIAGVAAFLLGDEGSWITGQVIAVDGGMSSVRT